MGIYRITCSWGDTEHEQVEECREVSGLECVNRERCAAMDSCVNLSEGPGEQE